MKSTGVPLKKKELAFNPQLFQKVEKAKEKSAGGNV
jgi:hypothetical protein